MVEIELLFSQQVSGDCPDTGFIKILKDLPVRRQTVVDAGSLFSCLAVIPVMPHIPTHIAAKLFIAAASENGSTFKTGVCHTTSFYR